MQVEIVRLGVEQVALARRVFALMVEVFEEGDPTPLSEAYVRGVLSRPEFFALAAVVAGEPVGGITAHALPMTRAQSSELFLYDLAVLPAFQRRGVGRALVEALRREGEAVGIGVSFVPADVEDEHALLFYRALGGEEAEVRIFTFG